MKSTCWETRATDSIIKSGQNHTEASVQKLCQYKVNIRHLQHVRTWEVQREMRQAANIGQAHHQFDNFFNSSKITKEEVTLELILPNFSGKSASLLNSIVLP